MTVRSIGVILLVVFALQIAACAGYCACAGQDDDGCVCCGQCAVPLAPVDTSPQIVAEILRPLPSVQLSQEDPSILYPPPRS